MYATGTPSVHRVDVSAEVRARSTLDRVDYADAFVAALPPGHGGTAESWARAALEGAPLAMRTALLSGWTSIGLELRRGAGTVLGWTVHRRTDDELLLRAGSRIGMPGELLIRCDERALYVSTFVQHGNPTSRAVWAGVEAVHLRVVPQLLEVVTSRGAPPA